MAVTATRRHKTFIRHPATATTFIVIIIIIIIINIIITNISSDSVTSGLQFYSGIARRFVIFTCIQSQSFKSQKFQEVLQQQRHGFLNKDIGLDSVHCRFLVPYFHSYRNRMYVVHHKVAYYIAIQLHIQAQAHDTIRFDSVYLTCSKKLTGSQLSLPHEIYKEIRM